MVSVLDGGRLMALGVKALSYIRNVVEETGHEDLTIAYFAAKVTLVETRECAHQRRALHSERRSPPFRLAKHVDSVAT